MIIDAKVDTEPRTWKITKIDRADMLGIILVTLKQSEFDEHTDYIEYDENGLVIGQWCDYFTDNIEPTDPTPIPPSQNIYSTITYSGTKPEIKSGGSYKKFTVNFYQPDGFESELQDGKWSFTIDSEDATDLVTVLTPDNSTDVTDNQIKIKFNKNDMYIGKVLTVKYTSIFGVESSVDMNIVGL